MAMNECQGCGAKVKDEDLGEVRRLTERVSPGDVMPSGECPHCKAVCHPIPQEKRPARVGAWKTSDDQLFSNSVVAYQHEADIFLKARVTEFADRHGFSPMTSSDLADILLEGIPELVAIFQEYERVREGDE